jgi:ElaB/YqjD/DUF883 family membrane-anchored ribosome-binding protein
MNTAAKLNRLVRDTEELLEQIADESAPQIQRVRERLQDSLEQTKSAIAHERNGRSDEGNGHGRPEGRLKVRDLAGSLNDYVRSYPWLALATGVLVASSVGILATHATKRSYHHDS